MFSTSLLSTIFQVPESILSDKQEKSSPSPDSKLMLALLLINIPFASNVILIVLKQSVSSRRFLLPPGVELRSTSTSAIIFVISQLPTISAVVTVVALLIFNWDSWAISSLLQLWNKNPAKRRQQYNLTFIIRFMIYI